jgi:hypothetical protein
MTIAEMFDKAIHTDIALPSLSKQAQDSLEGIAGLAVIGIFIWLLYSSVTEGYRSNDPNDLSFFAILSRWSRELRGWWKRKPTT